MMLDKKNVYQNRNMQNVFQINCVSVVLLMTCNLERECYFTNQMASKISCKIHAIICCCAKGFQMFIGWCQRWCGLACLCHLNWTVYLIIFAFITLTEKYDCKLHFEHYWRRALTWHFRRCELFQKRNVSNLRISNGPFYEVTQFSASHFCLNICLQECAGLSLWQP